METYKNWQQRAVVQEPPDTDQIVLIISGTLNKGWNVEDEDLIVSTNSSNKYYLVGVGILLTEENTDSVLHCTEITIPFTDRNTTEVKPVTMPVIARTRNYGGNWAFLWSPAPPSAEVSVDFQEVYLASTDMPVIPSSKSLPGYPQDINSIPETLYEYTTSVQRNVILSPQVAANFYSTEDYNVLLGNATDVAEPDNFHSFDSETMMTSEDTNKHEMARIYIEKLIPRTADTSSSYRQQVLDLAFFDFRSISASVYADQRISRKNKLKGVVSASIKSVWNNLQENNTEAPKVVYFTEPLNFISGSGPEGDEYLELEIQTPNTTYPVIGNVVFNVLTSRYVAKYTNAIVYCADNNTAYRTDANGIIVESYPERTYDTIESL